ncbi:Uncharacterised protein [Vibrio cholerae]|nr:Uncharacterised protein [Vibrio cholerae]
MANAILRCFFRVGQVLQCAAHWWRYHQRATQYHINRAGLFTQRAGYAA